MKRTQITLREDQIESIDKRTDNRSGWIRDVIDDKLNELDADSITDPELDSNEDHQDIDYNDINIQSDVTVDPDAADFSDIDVVKQNCRPAIFAAVIRYRRDEDNADSFTGEYLQHLAMETFGVCEETADRYINRLVDENVLYPDLSSNRAFSGTEGLTTLRQELADHYEQKAEHDVAFGDYPDYFRYRNYVTELTGTPDDGPWMPSPRDLYYLDRVDAFEEPHNYLSEVVREARSVGSHGERYCGKRVFSRLVAVAVDQRYILPKEVPQLLSLSPSRNLL